MGRERVEEEGERRVKKKRGKGGKGKCGGGEGCYKVSK